MSFKLALLLDSKLIEHANLTFDSALLEISFLSVTLPVFGVQNDRCPVCRASLGYKKFNVKSSTTAQAQLCGT